jgi:NAD(P)-dependent dehydrogenase (short-subunit alcohol dehydrogenase family)
MHATHRTLAVKTVRRTIVLTGVSRGLGAALFAQFVASGDRVLAVGRRFTQEQRELADAQPERLRLYTVDLADPHTIPAAAVLSEFFAPGADSPVMLVHNAAAVSPLGHIGSVSVEEMARAVAVNLTAAMVLTNSFLAARPPAAPARIVLVSSRAAEVAKAGQATYCATKSGAERFFEAVARETSEDPLIHVFSVRTPAMDTDMQAEIRSAVGLPDRDQFIARHKRGELSQPAEVAAKIIAEYLDA